MLWELLERGIRVFYQPPPFVHTKLFIVDDQYALIGSANIDPRSLRLNFELAVEVFDAQFVRSLSEHIQRSRERSLEVSLEDLDSRRLPVRLRDALSWLFSPYL
jgi:cardiolipin synthase